MLDIKIILQKLKLFLNVKTDLQLAEILKVKGNTISSWRIRNTLPFDVIINLSRIYQIDLNELFFDVTYLHKTYNRVDINNKHNIKIISSDMHFQYVLEGNDFIPDGDSFDFMHLENCKIAFQIISDNMSPTIRFSNFVVCERTAIHNLLPGAIYVVVVARKGISVHRFEQLVSHDEILFTNDNFLYKSEIISTKDIVELWTVKSAFLGNLAFLINKKNT